MQDRIKNHILIFGLIEYLPYLLKRLRNYSKQYICFVSDLPPSEKFIEIKKSFPNLIYFESSLNDVKDLERTGIRSAFHVILLSWLVPDSTIQDSGILPIAKLIEDNFKSVKFTLYKNIFRSNLFFFLENL